MDQVRLRPAVVADDCICEVANIEEFVVMDRGANWVIALTLPPMIVLLTKRTKGTAPSRQTRSLGNSLNANSTSSVKQELAIHDYRPGLAAGVYGNRIARRTRHGC